MTKLKSLEFEGITIPVTTPCKSSGTPLGRSDDSAGGSEQGIPSGGYVTPSCQIIAQTDHCAAGEIEQAYCTTCGEIVYQKIHR